jgi:hypothetical protein
MVVSITPARLPRDDRPLAGPPAVIIQSIA